MRVITGSARGRRLTAPEGLDVRPTSDKVKEGIFSAVQFDIPGSAVLDLFSGSGQLGIEALSRGAKSCVFVDNSRASLAAVRENLSAAGFTELAEVKSSDCERYLRMCRQKFDIAFIDPPYRKGLIERVMPPLCTLMSGRGAVICEHERGTELPESFGVLRKKKVYRYGKTEVTLYRAVAEDDSE